LDLLAVHGEERKAELLERSLSVSDTDVARSGYTKIFKQGLGLLGARMIFYQLRQLLLLLLLHRRIFVLHDIGEQFVSKKKGQARSNGAHDVELGVGGSDENKLIRVELGARRAFV
jgi:hypothetical protein